MNWDYPADGPWVPLTVSDGGHWVWNGTLAHRLPEPIPPPLAPARFLSAVATRPAAPPPPPPPWYARLWAAVVDAIDALMIR